MSELVLSTAEILLSKPPVIVYWRIVQLAGHIYNFNPSSETAIQCGLENQERVFLVSKLYWSKSGRSVIVGRTCFSTPLGRIIILFSLYHIIRGYINYKAIQSLYIVDISVSSKQ
jgi:hypothetical protein